jgi:hypothetical protein
MKITVRQLKQLIREQVLYNGKDITTYTASDLENSLGYNIPREDKENIRAELERRGTRNLEQDRLTRAASSAERSADRSRENAREQKIQKEGTELANDIIEYLNKKDAHKDPKVGRYIIELIRSRDDEVMAACYQALNKVKIPNFGNKRADAVVKMVTKKGWKPGLFGLGFMGLEEEIQQMVKEELRRQLKNRR